MSTNQLELLVKKNDMEIVIKEHTFFDDLLEDEITIIDLGACKGEFVNELSQRFKIKKAILVEANPTNFKLLPNKENYILYNKVVSSESNSNVDFYEDSKSPYNGSKIFNYFNGIKHKIGTITLEDVIKENKIEKIDILKVDIEGSEYDIMPNISDEVYSKIKQITIEFHDFIDVSLKLKTKEIIDKLESLGFDRISKPIKYMNNSDDYDVLFYKK
jgi:FkbM family methyltransferase